MNKKEGKKMKNELIIKKCLKCGVLIEVINDCNCKDCGIICCGKPMVKLTSNSVDASFEKHIPTFEKVSDEILVKVNHVMEKDHLIEWIALVNDENIYKVRLYPEQIAECRFKYIKGSKLYAYCNKHGLWSCEVE